MKRVIIALCLALLASASLAQTQRRPIRIQIRHADPWFVKAMLEGRPVQSPELSAAAGFMGLPGEVVNFIDNIFRGGTFVVNAGDNSLWWIPGSGGR